MRPRRGSPLLFLFAIGALVAAGDRGAALAQAYLGVVVVAVVVVLVVVVH